MLPNKKILLGVSGAIPAYKSVDLVRLLREQGAIVRVVMTAAAKAFVTPLTFQAISGHPVHEELFSMAGEDGMPHIELARWPDMILIAPASADIIARIAHGHANDLLTTICLAAKAPIIIAPSMNKQMWHNRITQDNVKRLREYNMTVIGPAEGSQACGDVGLGRMLEPDEIIRDITSFFLPKILQNKKVLITAGPTREAIDPVRYISNASSGKMGYALAEAAYQLGAEVTVISGPTNLRLNSYIKKIEVMSAEQMQTAVLQFASTADIFIAAAAVGDYRVAQAAPDKIKKSGAEIDLKLLPTPDIVSSVAALAKKPYVVGFALETNDLIKNAKNKLQRKNLDMIVANLVSENGGFENDNNEVTVITRDGEVKSYSLMPKSVLAYRLLEYIVKNSFNKSEIDFSTTRHAAT